MSLGEVEECEKTTSTTQKKTKSQKKHAKKYHKKVLNFLKEYNDNGNRSNGVSISEDDEPTPHLFIGNGGMLCGVSREDILMLFKKYGHITDLLLLPKKSYSLISFDNADSARQAFDSMEGYVFVKNRKTDTAAATTVEPVAPFYLKYLGTQSLEFAYEDVNSCEYPTECEPNLVDGLILREEFIDKSYEQRLYDFFHERCNQQQGMKYSISADQCFNLSAKS